MSRTYTELDGNAIGDPSERLPKNGRSENTAVDWSASQRTFKP
ncbi:hypothetical protein [Siminovitchia acidinfaciens]|nr:hypothetical protein [Siminovitchia acidinfaciens]